MQKKSIPWKGWHRANIQCKHFIPKAQTHWYTLWEHNICLGYGLVHYFEHGTHITTYNLVFAIFWASAEYWVPIFFLLMNHLKWWYKNESQKKRDPIGMLCNLGNQIGGPWHGLEEFFFGTLMPKGPDHEKVGTWPIFNVNTPFQWHISTLCSLEKILLFILYRQ
jgi:hypothetical protein